jgi:formylglycine-generating enzyme required for sulfatase activity
MTSEIFLFVSHVSEDRTAAMEIVEELEQRGMPCWIAPRDVRAGRPFDDEIANAIESSRAMLLIFSEHCNTSEYIRREVTFAGESRKVVIPFRIENAQPKHGLRVRLSDLHWLDGFASREKALDELVRTFPEAQEGAALRPADEPAPSALSGAASKMAPRRAEDKSNHPARPEQRPNSSWLRPTLIVAAVIGLAALGAFAIWQMRAPPTPTAPIAVVTAPPAPVAVAPPPAVVAPPPPVSPPSPPVVAPSPPASPPAEAAATPPVSTPASAMALTILSPDRERALKPKEIFKECEHCPEMIVVPAGAFTMGSPVGELKRVPAEGPQHAVTFVRNFAVGRFALTFDEWDACIADGACRGYKPDSQGWGRERRPVINVSWDDAQSYIVWLSRKTGKPYRLLSEAEREYVTRAGTTTPFWWGARIATSQANYNGVPYGGGVNGEYRGLTLPVDSFEPNPWGLYQVHGNVYEWMQDCGHDNYQGAPSDGSAWLSGDCSSRIIRGGSWDYEGEYLRSASRLAYAIATRDVWLGFRVARTLNAP